MNKVFMSFDKIFLRCSANTEEWKVSNFNRFTTCMLTYLTRDISWADEVTDNKSEAQFLDTLLSPFIFDSLKIDYENYLHIDRRFGEALVQLSSKWRTSQAVLDSGHTTPERLRRNGKRRISGARKSGNRILRRSMK